MISIENKFIIITPPKTGSVSIVTSLMKYINMSNILQQRPECFDYSDYFNSKSKHTGINEMYKKWNVNIFGDFNSYQKFGTVRNPWDRMVSWWRWETNGTSFANFIKYPSHFTSKDILQDHFSINNKIIIDSYIKFEDMQKDFDKTCSQIGIPTEKLPHMNKSKHEHYTEYYDDETREIVAQRYRKDIEYFGYKFGE